MCRDAEYDEADPHAPVGSDERIGDAIVICDMCNAGVHQKCYGRELLNPEGLPDGDWFCNRCTKLREDMSVNPSEFCCDLCNDLKGIIIEYTNKSTGHQGWAHISCINWTPEVWFLDSNTLEIDGDIALPRFNNTCYVCRSKKNTGSCISCDYKDCQLNFHVRCAIKKGLIKNYDEMIQQKHHEDDEDCFIFCDKHIELGKKELKQGGSLRHGAPSATSSSSKKKQLIDSLKPKSKASKRRVIDEEMEEPEDDPEDDEPEEDDKDDEDEVPVGRGARSRAAAKPKGRNHGTSSLVNGNHVPIKS